jgi:hypothetical protein
MGIKGLTRRAAVLGHIKIGGRKKISTQYGDRTIPVKYDHFVITTNEQDELGYVTDDVIMRRLMDDQLRMMKDENTEHIYEEKIIDGIPHRVLVKSIQHIADKELENRNTALRRILVTLPFDDPEENLVTSLSVYDREGCRCRGDNETAEWVDPRTGEVTKVNCPCNMLQFRLGDDDEIDRRPEHDMANRGMKPNESSGFLCKANGILRVKIEQARTIGGVYLFRTTSMNSIRQLLDSMNSIRDLTGGTLAGYPLNLIVEPKRTRVKPNKPPQIIYVVNLIFKADEDAFLRYVIEKMGVREQLRKQLNSKDIQQLPAPGHEDRREQVAIAQEYYMSDTPDDYIDGTAEEPSQETESTVDAEYEETPPPSDNDAPDALQEAPQKGSDAVESSKDSEHQESRQEAADVAESKTELVEAPKDSEHQETSQEPQEAETDAAIKQQDHDPEQQPQEKAGSAAGDKISQDGESAQKNNGEKSYPMVIIDKPEKANTKPATKELRKQFFLKARESGLKDADIREWIDELWEAKSSAALRTWQVEAMMDALR